MAQRGGDNNFVQLYEVAGGQIVGVVAVGSLVATGANLMSRALLPEVAQQFYTNMFTGQPFTSLGGREVTHNGLPGYAFDFSGTRFDGELAGLRFSQGPIFGQILLLPGQGGPYGVSVITLGNASVYGLNGPAQLERTEGVATLLRSFRFGA